MEKYRPTYEENEGNESDKPDFEIVALLRIHKAVSEKSAEGRVILSNFKTLHQTDTIIADLRTVAALKEQFEKELDEKKNKSSKEHEHAETIKYDKILSEIMEMTVIEFGETSNWFGEEAHLGQTSEYDRFINGANVMLVFSEDDESPIALSIDVTSTKDTGEIEEKIETTRRRALDRHADKHKIKYYQSPIDPDKRCVIETVPVVVGFTKENVCELIALTNRLMTLEKKSIKDETVRADKKQLQQDLSEHPLQINMLDEILMQLNYYAENMKGREDDYAKKLISLRDKIEQVVYEKNAAGLKGVDDDIVFKKIKKYCHEKI